MLTSTTLFWFSADMPAAEALHGLWRHCMMVLQRDLGLWQSLIPSPKHP